jgi:hypothetical protein
MTGIANRLDPLRPCVAFANVPRIRVLSMCRADLASLSLSLSITKEKRPSRCGWTLRL